MFLLCGLVLFGCATPQEKLLKQTCDLVKQHAEIAMTSRQNNNIDRVIGVLAYKASEASKILHESQPVLDNYIANMVDSAYDIPAYNNLDDKEQAIRSFTKEQEQMCYKSFVLSNSKEKKSSL